MTSPLLHRNASLSHVADHCRGQLCVMAAPWVDEGPWPQGVAGSAQAVRWLSILQLAGVGAICPLVQAVEMANADLAGHGPELADRAAWAVQFNPLYEAAWALIVPPLPGAHEDEEITALARRFGGRVSPVFYLAEQ